MARSSKAPLIGGIVLVALLAVPVGVWLMRDAVATSMALDELSARGLTCDDRFSVALSAGLGEATVGATRCTHEGGIVEAIELLGDVRVTLEGFEPASVTAESVRVTLRDQQVRGGSQWAAELRRLSLEQRVAGLIKGLAEVGQLQPPPIELSRVEIVRRDEPIAHGTAITSTPMGEGVQLGVGELTFPASVGRLRLRRVSGRATASDVHLEGQATAEAGIGGLIAFTRGGPFELTATRLDTGAPRFRLSGDF